MLKGIVGATLACGVGAASVSMGARTVEESQGNKPFSLRAERFDLSTMQGRFAKQLSNCDPYTLLATESDIRSAEKLLEQFKQGTLDMEKTTDMELWNARKLVESSVHPDTKEIIPQPFRMSGYVPFNGPVCVAMMASSSTPALLFWNWVNQSQNSLVNYFNRNASSPTSNETLLVSYCGAVGTALTVAFGLSQIIKRRYSPDQAAKLMKFVAFPSSVVASCSNCYIMRRPEIASGVSIMDEEGNQLAVGKRSSIAAQKAVEETVMSRAFLQVPVFFLPPALMSLPPIAAAAAAPAVNLTLTTLFTIVSFGFGLPAAVAYFPQIGTVAADDLEQEIRELLPEGTEKVYYNKGL